MDTKHPDLTFLLDAFGYGFTCGMMGELNSNPYDLHTQSRRAYHAGVAAGKAELERHNAAKLIAYHEWFARTYPMFNAENESK